MPARFTVPVPNWPTDKPGQDCCPHFARTPLWLGLLGLIQPFLDPTRRIFRGHWLLFGWAQAWGCSWCKSRMSRVYVAIRFKAGWGDARILSCLSLVVLADHHPSGAWSRDRHGRLRFRNAVLSWSLHKNYNTLRNTHYIETIPWRTHAKTRQTPDANSQVRPHSPPKQIRRIF